MSQLSSRRLSFIMPMTCAPSTAERIPFVRANPQSSFAGKTTPVAVVMWLKNRPRVRVGIAVSVEDRAQYRHGARAYRPVIEINLVRGNQELFAQFGPVRLFVRTVERAIWQLQRFLFEQRGPFRRQVERARRPGKARKRR